MPTNQSLSKSRWNGRFAQLKLKHRHRSIPLQGKNEFLYFDGSYINKAHNKATQM